MPLEENVDVTIRHAQPGDAAVLAQNAAARLTRRSVLAHMWAHDVW